MYDEDSCCNYYDYDYDGVCECVSDYGLIMVMIITSIMIMMIMVMLMLMVMVMVIVVVVVLMLIPILILMLMLVMRKRSRSRSRSRSKRRWEERRWRWRWLWCSDDVSPRTGLCITWWHANQLAESLASAVSSRQWQMIKIGRGWKKILCQPRRDISDMIVSQIAGMNIYTCPTDRQMKHDETCSNDGNVRALAQSH